MEKEQKIGHFLAIFTIVIWGTTFISTKILLRDFDPVQILYIRFLIGLLVLFFMAPKRLKGTSWKEELTFAGAGLTGLCLYYLLENIALTYTMASNVGVIIAVAPFFSGLITHFFMKESEKLGLSFFLGFVVAMVGVFLISFNGSKLHINPLGDLLTLLASIVWGFYALLSKKVGTFGYSMVLVTRRIFFYGILWMLPVLPFLHTSFDFAGLLKPVNLLNFLYLGVGASALCFVTWNLAVKKLGVITTSAYIYASPVVTLIASFLILQERLTPLSIMGTVFTLAGVILSESKSFIRSKKGSIEVSREISSNGNIAKDTV